MLKLIIGKAGSGKTGAVIREIKAAVDAREGGRLLIVPEQYSHEAERELCGSCGDSMSLYAEVFSFTGLYRRLSSQLGGGAVKYLDEGGRLLCMALALNTIGSRLKIYGAAQRKSELQAMLLAAYDELKSAGISSDILLSRADELGDGLGDKLSDLAVISECYDAIAANGHADPSDRLTALVPLIEASSFTYDTHIYVDGFIDFTFQEREVLRALVKKGVQLTVCLTVDDMHGDSEIYELSRRACRDLIACAEELGEKVQVVCLDESAGKARALEYFADNMFSYCSQSYDGHTDAVELFTADSITAECELAAAKALSLVRSGCRWRDIAVAVRGFDDYELALSSIFEYYGVPLFVSRKSDLLSKPLPAMIAGAYEIIGGFWEPEDVISYMRTGFSGLDTDECDELENYIFKWQLRGNAWKRAGDWHQHPEGYGAQYDDETNERLIRINELRRRLAQPLLAFEERGNLASTAAGQASALAGLFADVKLAELLEKRAEVLRSTGREALAQEYAQLWDIIVSALEQSAAVLGDTPMTMEDFGRLFTLMLSKYDVGTIPVALDRVSAGDFDRMRRRTIKHLIVLGASDARLPKADEGKGIFSEDERRRLLELDIDLGGAGEDELWREFALIYNCLTLPSESLTMCCPLSDADGNAQRPAFVYGRAKSLFRLEVKHADMLSLRLSASGPALTLAARGINSSSPACRAAAEFFEQSQPQRFAAVKDAARMTRGRLSPTAVEALYGRRLSLSASKIDKFASCKFSYFCQYGLKVKPYEPAGFTPPEIGTFMHYVLEHTARDVKARGGFAGVEDSELDAITDRYIDEYIKEELNDFHEKSPRFVYLFRRLSRDVHQVVRDMAQELRKSDFEPLDFELNFTDCAMPPVSLDGGENTLQLTGIADRVDGWLHDGKLYLRVVDYKTGKKKFSLSDVWYGMGLQMLLYLFALEENGAGLYGHEIEPAGVMYVPARDALLSITRNADDETILGKRAEQVRRSGLLLDDSALIEAWEHGDDKSYIPVKFKSGKPSEDSVASAARMGALARHIKKNLGEMATELRRGSIAADPYYRSQQENACLNCDYYDACHFSDGQDGESCRIRPKLSAAEVWNMMEVEQNG